MIPIHFFFHSRLRAVAIGFSPQHCVRFHCIFGHWLQPHLNMQNDGCFVLYDAEWQY